MTEQTPAPDALGIVRDLVTELEATRTEVAALRRSGRRTLKFVLFDVLITLGVFAAGAIGINAASSASHADSAQLALCQSSNVARAQQIGIWTFLLGLGSPPRTAHEKQVVGEFLDHLHKVYAPRNCAMLGEHKS